MNTGECYVCYEGNAPESPCICKNMYLHEECELNLITKLNKKKCTICKKQFNNIKYNIVKKYQLTNDCFVVIITMSTFSLIVIPGLYFAFVIQINNKHIYTFVYILGNILMIFACLNLMYMFIFICKIIFNNCKLLKIKKTIVPHIVKTNNQNIIQFNNENNNILNENNDNNNSDDSDSPPPYNIVIV
jgi:hypothetical protein